MLNILVATGKIEENQTCQKYTPILVNVLASTRKGM